MLLWWWANSPRLGGTAREAIATSDDVAISVASVWEIEIERALGRLTAPADLLAGVADDMFALLAIDGPHAVLAARLPQHHLDPFDRVLVAQSRIEQRVLVTSDQMITAYDVDHLTA